MSASFPDLLLQNAAKYADQAVTAGRCSDCGICHRLFTPDRAVNTGVFYIDPERYPDRAIVYFLCRRCSRLNPAEKAQRLARESAALFLGDAMPQGTA